MSTSAKRARGTVQARVAATAAIVAMLAAPMPARADSQTSTVLLTLTTGQSLSQLAEKVSALGGTVLDTLELSDSLIVRLPAHVGAPVGSAVIPDVPMSVNGITTSYDAKVPTYRSTLGLTEAQTDLGAGVTVALIDTGVDDTADGLSGVSHVNVTNARDGDGFGHGTFLAGIIAGNGTFPGVAPAAELVDVQVADAKGRTSLAKVLQGVEAAYDADADVVNISLSTDSPLPPGFDPLSLALERLWQRGVTVVTAAGNDGPDAGTIGSPGNDPMLITVGAVDEGNTGVRADDSVADFSARGKGATKNKPDLIAPGVSIVSTAATNSLAATENPDSLLGNGYMRGSGTSMSAAMVSGAAAAVLSANPSLTPSTVKGLLMSTTYTAAGFGAGSGQGGLDLAAALDNVNSAPEAGTTTPDADDDAWGPDEADAETWAAFAAAWEAGDKKAAKEAWDELSAQTQVWGARMFALAVVSGSADESSLQARGWAARGWAARGWAARGWAVLDWEARGWAARGWAARGWAARGWAEDEWAARGWADYLWEARGWAARGWASGVWVARGWASTQPTRSV